MKIGLVAGEASGDLLGAVLIRAIKSRIPQASFEGIAGDAMITAGCKAWEHAETLAVMGLIEPLKVLPKLISIRRQLVRRWTESPPDIFVGIDAPDFNLGLERRLKDAGIPSVHYVCPTVLAWRAGRINTLRRSVDRVLCIYPFEEAFCVEHGVDAVFVGHPKADAAPIHVDVTGSRQALGLNPDGRYVAVLPGSRRGEVSRLGPSFAAAARILSDKYADLRFITPVATPKLQHMIEQQLSAAGIAQRFTITRGESQRAMSAANVVLLASGTAALESALLRKPTVAAYKVSAVTASIIKTFGLIKVDRYTMPNLLTNTAMIPEYIQGDATPDALAGAVDEFLSNPEAAAAVADRFARLRSELAINADARAAEATLSLAGR